MHRLICKYHLRAADQVGEFASDRFQLRVDRIGDLRDEATCGDVDETLIVQAADIDSRGVTPEERFDGVRNVGRKAERRREVIARAQRDHAKGDLRQAMIKTRDAVQDLVERPVAAAHEEMIVAVADGLLGHLGRIAFGRGNDDVQQADAFTQLTVDRCQVVRRRVRSGKQD